MCTVHECDDDIICFCAGGFGAPIDIFFLPPMAYKQIGATRRVHGTYLYRL